MFKYLILFMFFSNLAIAGGDMIPLVSKIKILSPQITESKAKELASHFTKIALEYGISAKVLTALSFQESSFKYSVISGNDIGLFQLNYKWQVVKRKEINLYSIERLNEDWRLNTRLAARHLSECIKDHPKSSPYPAWVCFHSRTPKYQKIYYNLVKKHLDKLK